MWDKVSDWRKKKMEVKADDDGEFYMSLEDFWQIFGRLEICHLTPTSLEHMAAVERDGQVGCCSRVPPAIKFDTFAFPDQEWSSGTSGGCGDNSQGGAVSFARNPQVRFMKDVTESTFSILIFNKVN